MENVIKISQCDNQLLLFAVEANGETSYEICNISSGYNNIVDVEITLVAGAYTAPVIGNGNHSPLHIKANLALPKGDYFLLYAGINWGGPYNFEFTFQNKPHQLANDSSKPLIGVIWNKAKSNLVFSV